jgi:hypothetical protein
MITPSQTKLYSPYGLSDEQSDLFWRVENEITAALRDGFQGDSMEFLLPVETIAVAIEEHTIVAMQYHLSDHGWSAVWDDQRGKMIVYPKPVSLPR